MTFALILLAAVAVVLGLLATRALRGARDSEARYRELAANSPDVAVMLLDRDLKIVLFEGLALERQGWRAEDFLRRPLPETVPPERMEELRPHLEAALRGERGRQEWTALRSDAIYRVDTVPFGHRDAIDHVMLVIRDITEERALRATLEERERFFGAVLAEAAGRLQVCDANGRLINFGADPLHPALDEDMHPLEWAERFGLLHPDGSPFGPHETPLLRALRGEQVRDVELRLETPAGWRSMLASGGPVKAQDGRLLGAVVTLADLTARYDAEEALRASEERHRRVVESMSDCVFEADAHGRWTYLNEAWEAATGFTPEESLGRSALEFVHPDDRQEHARAFAPLLRGEQASVRFEHRFLTKAGTERWVEVQARAVSGWDGLPTGFVGVMRDVTTERRTERHVAAERAVVRVLGEARSFEAAAEPLLEALCAELCWDAGELWRMGDDERLRVTAAWADAPALADFLAAGARHAFEVGDGLPGQAWMSREPVWRSGDGGIGPPRSEAAGVQSTVALPLRVGEEPIGVVTLVSRTPREQEPGLTRLLETVAAHVAQFSHRQAAEHAVASRTDDLRTLARVAHELASQTDLYAARNALCVAVRDMTGASSVVLWEPPGADAHTLAVTAAVGAAVHGMTLALGERSAAGAAFLTGDPMFAADVAGDARVGLNWHGVTGAASAAWFPAVHEERCVGVLAVGWPEARPELSERDEEVLRLLTAEAAVTIHRTALLGELRSSARTDPLTGLPNRRVWEEDLTRELARAARHGGCLCLVMLDLDRFKAFNDDNGHPAGDRLLAATAQAWRPVMRETDTLARYGGEEFAVLLPHSDREGARAVVERLLAAVPHGQTASAGIAVWDGAETAEALLGRADAALYEAKHAGRARAVMAA